MKRSLLLRSLLAASGALALFGAQPVLADQRYPTRPLRLILPTPAGGPSDTAARTVVQLLGKQLGQPVVVENKAGANGAIAAQALVAAPADGYTLLWSPASMATLPMLQKAPPFRALADLTPVALIGHFAYGLFVGPTLPARSVAELVEHGRRQPDKLSYATGTLGEYLSAVQFLQATGIRALRVPYKGGAQLMPDLLAGRVDLNLGPVSSGLQHVRAGKLKMLAVLRPQRVAAAPEVPTLAEAGVQTPALPTWQAIFAPPGTDPAIAARLSAAIARVLQDPAVRAQLDEQALQVDAGSPEVLARTIAADAVIWQDFIRQYGVPQE